MTKKDYTEFTCDKCKTKLMSSWGFPYEQGWIYLYKINGKTLEGCASGLQTDTKFIKGEDLHFCEKKCFVKWINKKFKTGFEKKKVKK